MNMSSSSSSSSYSIVHDPSVWLDPSVSRLLGGTWFFSSPPDAPILVRMFNEKAPRLPEKSYIEIVDQADDEKEVYRQNLIGKLTNVRFIFHSQGSELLPQINESVLQLRALAELRPKLVELKAAAKGDPDAITRVISPGMLAVRKDLEFNELGFIGYWKLTSDKVTTFIQTWKWSKDIQQFEDKAIYIVEPTDKEAFLQWEQEWLKTNPQLLPVTVFDSGDHQQTLRQGVTLLQLNERYPRRVDVRQCASDVVNVLRRL
jgi:hypothetical protein